MLLRQNRFAKVIRPDASVHGGKVAVRKHSQSRVLPSAKLAYETGLSAGSIAVKDPAALHRLLHGTIRLIKTCLWDEVSYFARVWPGGFEPQEQS